MTPILFIDRDGTIIHETLDEKIEKIEKLSFLDNVIYYLRKISEETNFQLVMVSNQDGLGTDVFPNEEFWPVQDFIIRTLKNENIKFLDVHIDEHFEHENHPNRKPGIGMLEKYLEGGYDIKNSFVIGDRESDIELAKNLGCKSIYIQSAYSKSGVKADLVTETWEDIFNYLAS